MLFVLICTFLGVWACASAAARPPRSLRAFWLWYGLAVAVVPVVGGLVLRAVLGLLNPDYAATLTPAVIQLGMGLALVAYPVKYLRSKLED